MMAGAFLVAPLLHADSVHAEDCTSSFLTFPTWYKGLTDKDCSIKAPSDSNGGISKFIWTIVLNILDIAFQIIGYTTTIFIIYGGFLYLTSGGASDRIASAKKTITNAAIGLVIAILSVGTVTTISGMIK
jgi:hypothetical protein